MDPEQPDVPLVRTPTTSVSTQDFFRSLTNAERAAMRPTLGGARARDLKEDLDRESQVIFDDETRAVFEASGVFSTERIDELFS